MRKGKQCMFLRGKQNYSFEQQSKFKHQIMLILKRLFICFCTLISSQLISVTSIKEGGFLYRFSVMCDV